MSSILDDKNQPTQQNNPANYKQRILSATIILLALVAFFVLRLFVNVYVFDLMIGGLMIVSAFEVDNLLHKMGRPTYVLGYGIYPLLVYISVLFCLFMGLNFLWYVLINLGLIVVLGLLMAFLPMISQKRVFKQRVADGYKYSNLRYCVTKSLNTCFVCVWPVFLFSFAFAINHFNSFEIAIDQSWLSITGVEGVDIGIIGLLLLFSTTMIADTFAMLSGRLIKSPKINMEKLGKGKSWSGFFGGIVGATLVAMALFGILSIFSLFVV